MTALVVEDLTTGYDAEDVLRGVGLALADGQTGAVLGPSGSGKSTLLAAIAGFIPARTGRIVIGDRVVASSDVSVPPERRSVGVVFQDHALWPHMSVLDNVAYPLRRSRDPSPESEAGRLLEGLGIADLAARGVDSLSGGQQQRVSIARALARKPSLFLFDEPTSALDGALRDTVREQVEAQRRATGSSALYATHDAGEALAVADVVVLLRNGVVVQTGGPRTVYEEPVDEWAARLTGPASVVDAVADGGTWIVGGVDSGVEAAAVTGAARLVIRPEWAAPGGPLPGSVMSVSYRGSHTDYRIDTPAGQVVVRSAGPPRADRGDAVGWMLERCWVLR